MFPFFSFFFMMFEFMNTYPFFDSSLHLTRRHFFGKSALGVGTAAMARLLHIDLNGSSSGFANGLHHKAKAKRVIYLFMSGGPSHLDLWDYKPKLSEEFGKDLPANVRDGQRITGMTSKQKNLPVCPSKYKFTHQDNNADGVWISELLPHTSTVAKDLCVVHTAFTEAINHDPAITYIQSGSQIPGRPSLGAWLSYGLGSLNKDLPDFVVVPSAFWSGRVNVQALYARLWGSGFLPSRHQGTSFQNVGDPVLFLSNPRGIDPDVRRRMLDTLGKINAKHQEEIGDPEIQTTIAQQEMAFRMQASVPGLMDTSDETQATMDLYGTKGADGTFAANCLLARRLAERGCRFIQLYHCLLYTSDAADE